MRQAPSVLAAVARPCGADLQGKHRLSLLRLGRTRAQSEVSERISFGTTRPWSCVSMMDVSNLMYLVTSPTAKCEVSTLLPSGAGALMS